MQYEFSCSDIHRFLANKYQIVEIIDIKMLFFRFKEKVYKIGYRRNM